MYFKIFSVSIYVFAIIIFIITLLLESKKYSQSGFLKYSLLRNFPYELNPFKAYQKSSYVFLALKLFSSFLFISSFLLFSITYNYLTSYILFTLFTLAIIVFNILTFFKLNDYKKHLIVVIIHVAINLILLALTLYYFVDSSYWYATKIGVRIFEAIYIVILVIFECFLLFNNSYKDWFRKIDFDNTSSAENKKISYLPTLEWGNFLITLLIFIAYIVIMFF